MSDTAEQDRFPNRNGPLSTGNGGALSDNEILERFLKANVRFLAPDPEIMRSFTLAKRTKHEDRVLSGKPDIHVFKEIRDILQGACDRDMEVVRQMVASPAGRSLSPRRIVRALSPVARAQRWDSSAAPPKVPQSPGVPARRRP